MAARLPRPPKPPRQRRDGRAVALLYAHEGADVAIVYLPYEQPDAEETQRVVEEQGRTCLLLPGDLCDPDFCREVVAQTVRRFGRLNILANNSDDHMPREGLADLGSEAPLDRPAQPEDIAPAYVYLASDADSSSTVGEVIAVTGGIVDTR
ncbi:SDR family oxidoreductase [Streptomyces sp. DASNCL29]|uniref:SDR family oxidoreductase n=1 Tax=Streptomyces sp. DASNCL29 TaxID=2583819 RepID=UPI001F0DBF2B|nr:SDR family oxidoreductase [Streptomyces sp. DASNCL29]